MDNTTTPTYAEASAHTKPKTTFQLKGGLYHFMTLRLLAVDLPLFAKQLDEQLQQAPNFFRNASIVLDLQKINHINEIDFSAFTKILRNKNLFPLGVTHASEAQKTRAILAGLAPLYNNAREVNQREAQPHEAKSRNTNQPNLKQYEVNSSTHQQNGITTSPTAQAATKLITSPVRSGQQIYAPDGDLIITAAVGNGAEILADGNIHIYAPLRGKALAGVNGNKAARIFCKSLEAELVSIAGQFQITDDFSKDFWQQAVEISLKEERLQIKQL